MVLLRFIIAPFKPHSCHTAFSNCSAASLVENKKVDVVDQCKRFTQEFFNNPHRGYGSNVSKILVRLRGTKFLDPYAPAKEQYMGMGSYGNSAAAIIAPVALFYSQNLDEMICGVSSIAKITQSHQLGINGALFQSFALYHAINSDNNKLIRDGFLDFIAAQMKNIEQDDEGLNLKNIDKYQKQLSLLRKLLAKDPTVDEVVNTLGHAKVAHYSVPTALYCFLRSAEPIDGIDTSNSFRRTVQYAVSLGGDTDTIASMAGALAGSFYGYGSISENMQKHCENVETVTNLANELVGTLIINR